MSKSIPELVLWGGGSNSSIYRSTDYGTTWNVVFPYSLSVTCFAENPTDSNHIIAGGYNSVGNSQIYHSYNAGATWDFSPAVLSGTKVKDVTFTQSGQVLYATDDGVYADETSGEIIKLLDCSANALTWDNQMENLYLACDDSAVYQSSNLGQTWNDIASFHRGDIDVVSIEVSNCGNWLFAGTYGFGVFRLPLTPSGIGVEGINLVAKGIVSILETPTSNSVSIRISPIETSSSLLVYDVSGRIVAERQISPSTTTVNVVISEIASGVYFTGLAESDSFESFVILR